MTGGGATGTAPAANGAMPAARARLERRLRLAGGLVIGGLAVEGLSFLGLHHPLGFLSFALVGGALLAAGILTYLWSLAR